MTWKSVRCKIRWRSYSTFFVLTTLPINRRSSRIRIQTPRCTFQSCSIYGCEIWTVTNKTLAKRLDAFDTWCLRKILRIPYPRHTTNETVHSIIACQSLKRSSFRLRFFGHLARSTPEEDHHRVIAAALRPPTDWRRPIGRPRTTWLRTIDEDVQPRTSESTRHGGRQETGIFGTKFATKKKKVCGAPSRGEALRWDRELTALPQTL